MIDALKAIEKPLAEPCSQDDISQLETKKNIAKESATAAVEKQTKIKEAANEKLKAANEKLQSLNEQIESSSVTENSNNINIVSLTEAAVKAKEEANKAEADIEAALAGYDAAVDAFNELDALNLNDFLGSRRSKRQNTNTIIAPPGTDVQLQSSSETSNDNNAPPGSNVQAESSSAIAISADGIQVGGIQIESSSETVTSSSAYPVPTTCATLKNLMDDIIKTLKDSPADVRPMVDALKAIKKPLAEPCSQDDISQLETKKNTAKESATAAVEKQTKIKEAATEKLKAANEKLESLNEQLANRNCFNLDLLPGYQYYELVSLKTIELGIWKFVFDQNSAITMSFRDTRNMDYSEFCNYHEL